MRVAKIVMWGCDYLQKTKPTIYIGYQLKDGERIEHLLIKKTENGLKRIRLRAECDKCILGRLIKSSKLVAMPVIIGEKNKRKMIKFIVLYNREIQKLLTKHREQLVDVEIISIRRVMLTDRQREVLVLAANGTGTSPTRIASKLNISRQAAQKILYNLVRKLAVIVS